LVGGRDARTLTLAELRRNIAVVSQDTYLFHGTVEDNLRMGKPAATAAELEGAARAANAHEFIAKLPQGYQTVVGERGVRLSGGQRQRIAIARAAARRAYPRARRSVVVRRRGKRSRHPGSTRSADARAHHADLRAPALQRDRRRSHPRARRRARGREWTPCGADGSSRRLSPVDGGPATRRRCD